MLTKTVKRNPQEKECSRVLRGNLCRAVEIFCRRDEFAALELHQPAGHQII